MGVVRRLSVSGEDVQEGVFLLILLFVWLIDSSRGSDACVENALCTPTIYACSHGESDAVTLFDGIPTQER